MHVKYILEASDLPQACIEDCSAQGDVAESVEHWRKQLAFTVDRARATDYLRGFGAWEDDELGAMTDDEIAARVLWTACGTFSVWQKNPEHGSDCIALES